MGPAVQEESLSGLEVFPRASPETSQWCHAVHNPLLRMQFRLTFDGYFDIM